MLRWLSGAELQGGDDGDVPDLVHLVAHLGSELDLETLAKAPESHLNMGYFHCFTI